MDLKELHERQLIPRAALTGRIASSILGDVFERSNENDSECDNEPRNSERISTRLQLSPFGSIYYVLDQLTSPDTIEYLSGSDKLYVNSPRSPRSNQVLRPQLDKTMYSISELCPDLSRSDLDTFFSGLFDTFPLRQIAIDLPQSAWPILFSAFIYSSVYKDKLDMKSLSGVLSLYNLQMDKFIALSGVFDRRRHE